MKIDVLTLHDRLKVRLNPRLAPGKSAILPKVCTTLVAGWWKSIRMHLLVVLSLGSVLVMPAKAELNVLNAGGYSGLGMVPSANVIDVGQTAFAFDNQIPGVPNAKGYNYNLGFGVYDNLEATSRLATQDLHCNMFVAGNCPSGQIRDFSTSIKYKIPKAWVPFLDKDTSLAVGDVDFGGAAAYFGSKYAVATHKLDQLQVTLGVAKGSNVYSTLHGLFGGLQWDVNRWSRLSYDQINREAWIHSTLYAHPFEDRANFYLSLNNQLTHSTETQRSWIGMGVEIPLSLVKETNSLESAKRSNERTKKIRLPRIKPFDFQDELAKQGFSKARFGFRDKDLILWVDQENYQWNAMDAAGVAMGVLASTFAEPTHHFDLVVGNRGLDVLQISGDTACLKKWLEQNDPCYLDLKIQSSVGHSIDVTGVKWSFDTSSHSSAELVLSPTFVNTLGTEYSVFDIDVGANVNPVFQLWSGGYLDINAVVPLGVRTQNFNENGPFYSQRLSQQISRQVFHQMVGVDKINTQVMATLGKIYQNYTGFAMETQTFLNKEKVRLDLQGGEFKDKELVGIDSEKKYGLASLRYSMDNRYNTTTELQGGKFWNGDLGVILTERFWHGDVALNFYLQRSRQLDTSYINFAGFQIWIPLTPRVNHSFEAVNVRGTSQFSFTADSKVAGSNNAITTSLGVVPKTGDTLIQLSNQDRNSDRYFELRRERLRQAYFDLRVEDRKSWVFD